MIFQVLVDAAKLNNQFYFSGILGFWHLKLVGLYTWRGQYELVSLSLLELYFRLCTMQKVDLDTEVGENHIHF